MLEVGLGGEVTSECMVAGPTPMRLYWLTLKECRGAINLWVRVRLDIRT